MSMRAKNGRLTWRERYRKRSERRNSGARISVSRVLSLREGIRRRNGGAGRRQGDGGVAAAKFGAGRWCRLAAGGGLSGAGDSRGVFRSCPRCRRNRALRFAFFALLGLPGAACGDGTREQRR